MMRRLIVRILSSNITPYIVILLILVFLLTPYYWIIISSFKSWEEIYRLPPTFIPEKPTLKAYIDCIFYTGTRARPSTYFTNTVIIAVSTTVIVALASTLTAYGLSHYRYKGSEVISRAYLLTRTIPPLSLLISFYQIFLQLGLINNLLSVIIWQIYMEYPFQTWLIKLFFDAFPRELIDSAKVDGCSRTGTLFRIVLPVTAPAIAAMSVLVFSSSWSTFIAPMIFLHDHSKMPITVGIWEFVTDEYTLWSDVAAFGMLGCIPTLIFFIVAQKHIIKGLTAGALKY